MRNEIHFSNDYVQYLLHCMVHVHVMLQCTCSHTCTGSRDATPLVTMGTLDDIDKDYSKLAAQPLEDEALDLQEWSAPPVISEHLTSLFPPFQVGSINVSLNIPINARQVVIELVHKEPGTCIE